MPISSSDRWCRVERLFHSTLALPADEREAFLDAECGSDRAVYAEVLSLVQADDAGEAASYEAWAPQVAAAWASDASTSLVGQTIGRYRVCERLGAGAMGEVYRAEDTGLRRHVALKTLLPLAGDAARMRRLEHEARTASALNHPNILTIYEIGEIDSVHFIAAELVEGDTLRDRLARGPLALDEALDIAGQVAVGLGAAHAAGAIHRDIKPENLMVRRDGLVKIVDFGLAETIAPIASIETIEAACAGDGPPTGTRSGTRSGALAGTLTYMSPEQAVGAALDARTDLFSLGVVLYEMVAGSPPFARDSVAATLDALLHEQARPTIEVNPTLPPELDAVLARALEKNRDRRYQAASDFEADLKRLHLRLRQSADRFSGAIDLPIAPRPTAAPSAAPTTATLTGAADTHAALVRWGGQRRLALRAVAVLALVAITLGLLGLFDLLGLLGLRSDSENRGADAEALDPARLSFVRVTKLAGEELFPSLSPDGQSVAYASAAAGNWDVYVHPVNGDAVNLTAGSDGEDIQPVYSPDGQRILFRSERDGGGLFVMSPAGGAVTRVTEIGFDPAWSPDGREIVCSTARVEPTTVRLPPSELWVVDARSGRKRRLVNGPAYQPQWSPSGLRIAFFGPDAAGQRDLWTIAASGGGNPVRVTTDRHFDWNPVWSADGRFLYFLSDRDGTMNAWRVRIDEATGRPLGAPTPFTLPAANVVHFARAPVGEALTWSSRFGGGLIQRYELDPKRGAIVGKPESLTSPSRSLVGVEVSSDGQLLVANTRGEARDDIVILRADGSELRALTQDEPRDREPRWSPDGSRVAFCSDRDGGLAIFVVNADGSGLERVSNADERQACCPVWSPDGRQLAYQAGDLTVRAIDLTVRAGPTRDRVLARLPPDVYFQPVSWSPDDVHLAGQERHGNKPRAGVAIYNLITRQYTRLTRSGGRPIWLNDNRRLLYSDASSAYVLDIATGRARELFSVAPYQSNDLTVTRDNRQLYVSVRATEADVWVAVRR